MNTIIAKQASLAIHLLSIFRSQQILASSSLFVMLCTYLVLEFVRHVWIYHHCGIAQHVTNLVSAWTTCPTFPLFFNYPPSSLIFPSSFCKIFFLSNLSNTVLFCKLSLPISHPFFLWICGVCGGAMRWWSGLMLFFHHSNTTNEVLILLGQLCVECFQLFIWSILLFFSWVLVLIKSNIWYAERSCLTCSKYLLSK